VDPTNTSAESDAEYHVPTTRSFRRQILAGKQPSVSDVTLEAVLSAYNFRPTVPDPTILSSLSPDISGAIAPNPMTGELERFCNIAVNARMFDWARRRPELELVLAIDVSGSMAAPFETKDDQSPSQPSKLAALGESLAGVIQRLSPTDALGVVLFDTDAKVLKPVGPVDNTTQQQFRDSLANINPAGNTNVMSGLRHAGNLFGDDGADAADTERRILLVSDSPPTMNTQTYLDCCRAYQRRDIGTTFLGLEFPTVGAGRALCQVPGANVSFVETAPELAELHRQHLDSLLFPVASDVTVEVDNDTEITDFAAPSDSRNAESVFHRRTVFPSGPTTQSLSNVLFELAHDTNRAEFRITWRDRNSGKHETTAAVDFTEHDAEWMGSDNIRANIALYRYLHTVKRWCRKKVSEAEADNHTATHRSNEQSVTQLETLRTYLTNQQERTRTDQFETDIGVLSTLLSRYGH